MADQATNGELFDLAIAAEETAEELYRGLEARFAHHEDAAAFWRLYAAEEAAHAHWLARIRDALSPEQLAAPADPQILESVRKALGISVENALKGIGNLEDAYQLVSEIENSETNAVFEFLIAGFSAVPEVQSFLRVQLRDHIGRIMIEFPERFGNTGARRAIRAAK
jgi:rubrerythrin